MDFKAPGVDDERQSWLLTQIHGAQSTLDSKIAEANALPDSDLSKSAQVSRLNAMKREVGTVFSGLDRSVHQWADDSIPSFYQSGWFVAGRQTGASMEFSLPHREALDILSWDAYDDVGTRLQQYTAEFNRKIELQKMYQGLDPADIALIQTKSREAIAQSLLTGEADPKKVAKKIADDLWEDGVTIVDAGGNHWEMETYTRMLVRTKSANAYSSGTLNKYTEEGVKRVRVHDGVVDDKECAAADGKSWTIKYAMEHVIEHPNCRRAFSAIQGHGAVDNKSAQENVTSLTADRSRGTWRDWASAIRKAYRTGELNVASTTAVFLTEKVADKTGLPQPLVQFGTKLTLGRKIRSADAYIESIIDPMLYSVGLIDNIPERAILVKMKVPQNIVNHLSGTIMQANKEAFGEVVHPKVKALTTILDAASDSILGKGGYARKSDAFYKQLTTEEVVEMFGLLTGALKDINKFGAQVDAIYKGVFAGTLLKGLEYYRDIQTTARRFNVEVDLHQQFVDRSLRELGVIQADYYVKRDALTEYLAGGVQRVKSPQVLQRLMNPMASQSDTIVASVAKARLQLDEVVKNLDITTRLKADITEIQARAFGRIPSILDADEIKAAVQIRTPEAIIKEVADDIIDDVTGTVIELNTFRRAATGTADVIDERTPASVTDFETFKAKKRAAAAAVEDPSVVDTQAKVVDLDAFRSRKEFEAAGDPTSAVATGTGVRTGTGAATGTGVRTGTGTGVVTDFTGGRKLTMGATKDAVDPLGNETLLSADEMDDVVDALRGSLDDFDSAYSDEALDDFTRYFKLVREDGEDGALFAELEQFIFPVHVGDKKLTKWETLNEVIEQLDGLKIDRATGVVEMNGVSLVADTPESNRFIWAMLAIEPEFWVNTSFWQDVIGYGPDTGMILRHLPPAAETIYDRGILTARLWQDLTRELQTVSDEIGTSVVHFANLRRSLDEIYGAANVSTIAESGINGEIYKVTDSAGRVFLVKPLTSGHGGDPHMITLSHGITDLLSSKIDDVPVSIETRVLPLSVDGDDYVAVMPYFVGEQISESLDDITAEGMSRLNLLDRIVLEADPNLGNSLVNKANRRAVAIDTESAFGLIQGTDGQRLADYGFLGDLPLTNKMKHIKSWVEGDDAYRRATNAPPLSVIKLTEEEQAFFVPKARRFVSVGNGYAGGLVGGDGATIIWRGTPTLIKDGKLNLIGGRAAVRTGHNATYMEVVHYATKREAALLDDMLNHRLHGDISDVIRKRIDELSPKDRDAFIADWAPGESFDVAVTNAADRISFVLSERAAVLLDEGIVNTTGGVVKHVADDGTVYEIGKKVDLVRTTEADQWNPMRGIVTDIYDGSDGQRHIIIAQEMGQGHTTKELEAIFSRGGRDRYGRGARTEIRADQWSDTVIAERLETNTYAETIQEKLDTKHVRRRVSDNPREVDVHVYDKEGIPVGFRTENVQVNVTNPGRSGVRFAAGDSETIVSWEQIIDSGKIDRLIDDELAKMAPADRPLTVVVHFAPIRDNNGNMAFGYIKMDERRAHITTQSAAQLPTRNGPVTGRVALDLGDDADLDDIDALIDGLDWDTFIYVVDHEFSHSMDSGREATQRAVLAKAVRQEILDKYPDADSVDSLDDLIMYLGDVDLIPRTYVPSDPDMSIVAQLVEHRVELVEDVINTQLVNETHDVLEAAVNHGAAPSWVQKAYKGIREGDPDAHHEFIAELGTRIMNVGVRATAAEIDREVWSLFPNSRKAKRLISRSTIPLPKNWDTASPEFIEWLHRYTGGDVIPRHRSTNTKFWHEEFSRRQLSIDIRAALDAGEEGVGGTVHLTGFRPTEGFAVARSGTEGIVYLDVGETAEVIQKRMDEYVKVNRKRFLSDDDWYFGYWVAEVEHPETGEKMLGLYFDVVRVIDDEVDAAYFGYREQQRAMYRLHDGGEQIDLTDAVADFKTWLNMNHPDMSENEVLIMTNRIGASRTKVNPTKEIIEVIDKRGKMVPISRLWMTKEQNALLDRSYRHEYRYAKSKIAKSGKYKGQRVAIEEGSGSNKRPIPIKKKVTVTKKRVKANFERVLQRAQEYIGDDFVPDALPDVEWVARRHVTLSGEAAGSKETVTALRSAFKVLDDYRVLAPAKFELDEIPPNRVRLSAARTKTEVIFLRMGESYDTDGSLGRQLRELGFEPTSRYGALGDQEFFAESVLSVFSGRASEELTAFVVSVLPENQSIVRRDRMRFYEMWHGVYTTVAADTGIPVDRIVANAAILSAGMDATVNREAGIWMARMVAENHQFTPSEMKVVRAYFDEKIVDYTKYAANATTDKARATKLAELRRFKRYRRGEILKNNMRLDQAESAEMGAHMLQALTNTVVEQIVMPDGSTRKLSLTGRYGMPQVERGYAALTGAVSVNDALGDTKIRSFFNNIMDPKDWYGVSDVTVDFHMANMALWVLGMQHPKAKSDEPRILGMAAGLRPLIGDALRELFDESEWGTILGIDSAAEMQEILWETWRLGFEEENLWWGDLQQATRVPYARLVKLGWAPPLKK